tara:strand:+ start:62 stop:586 length:525 start_codon:yes stop_codon:yes gene_type:complete
MAKGEYKPTWLKKVSDETKAEMDEIVAEAEELVAEYLCIDKFSVHDRHDTGKSSLPEALVIKLTCGFLWYRVHKYTDIEKRFILTNYFGIVRATLNHHMRDVVSILSGTDTRQGDMTRCFKHTWDLMKDIGIKMNVEGWIKSKEMRIRFIDRQIDMMEKRKKQILNKEHETAQV